MASVIDGVKKPTFDASKVTVIYVLGGPGAGKGTQCGRLVEDFGFSHLSAGDLLRAEQNREGSQYGDQIRTCIRGGTIVPQEITIKLLEMAMSAELKTRSGHGWTDGKGRFLIDGFPRKMDQALTFEETVCAPSQVLVFEADEEVMIRRILERGKTSGREDDNIESLKKRFQTDKELVQPVIKYLENKGKVIKINSNQSIEQCHKEASEAIHKVLV
ncbi:UMP-CMP kinase [Boletus edulis BED1]|uniref:UMP-CMP kinase n=1 Tax=Boletus edulis BED1 TaxID=1328754 RepID=A0AAD4C4Y7_BOLED|nr:UMP-CMP kinase [Boletus edulis BED1]